GFLDEVGALQSRSLLDEPAEHRVEGVLGDYRVGCVVTDPDEHTATRGRPGADRVGQVAGNLSRSQQGELVLGAAHELARARHPLEPPLATGRVTHRAAQSGGTLGDVAHL